MCTCGGQENLRNEIESLKAQLSKHKDREAHYDSEIEILKDIIISFKRRAFAPKKERWESQEQLVLQFNEAEVEANKQEAEDNSPEVEVSSFTRKRGKRKVLPEHLPREIVTIELPENERFTDDGQPLKVIGKEVSEKLFYEPSKMKVIQYHRLRYGVDSGDPVKTAPPVPSIIPKGIVTPSLLAHIVTQKYADGLPLYRQEEIWSRQHVDMSRSSMGRWIVQSAQACVPVWNVLEDWLLMENYVSCDETHTQVLKEKGRSAESKSWMWVRATPGRKNPIVLFDYDPHRSGEVAKRLFADYRGYLQTDGYGAYNPVEKQDGVIRIGCNMHGRRGFFEANEGAREGRGLAAEGLKYYQLLYAIEEKAKTKGLSVIERHDLRKTEAAPILDEMKAWAIKGADQVPPKSKIGQAFGYFLNEYERLRGYLLDGSIEIDNGFAERAIRKFAIGRNNWLFSDTEAGQPI